jgi:hypothetical protein
MVMGIDISAITDALCQIAIDEKADVGEPEIFKFHEEVLKIIKRYNLLFWLLNGYHSSRKQFFFTPNVQ